MTTATLTLDADQQRAADVISEWIAGRRHEVTFSGLAGTGKSTVLSYLYDDLRSSGTLFLAPTAKAAYVLREKGVPAVTVHSAIYLFNGVRETDDGREIPQFSERDDIRCDFTPRRMAVDESSMLTLPMVNDLRAKELPLLFVGDGGQLPCVGEDPHLLDNADISLEKVHRQAGDSGILRLAHDIRGGEQPGGRHRCEDVSVVKISNPRRIAQYAIENDHDQIICAFNKTRCDINRAMRFELRRKGMLDEGDRVICRFNNWRLGLFNGQQFFVETIHSEDAVSYTCDLRVDLGGVLGENTRRVRMQKISLGNAEYVSSMREDGCEVFDLAFCITCHSSQGSSFRKPLVVYQQCKNWSMARWGYTAVTRAEEAVGVCL